ncbi:MAG: hypothetical protein NWF05_04090 [Candidatus Bathyarchaeota archaeon]|nr:hypothetical protein [Candidatus Bathyarchaeota archaeon]
MKKPAVIFALIIFSMAIFLPFSLSNQAANAQTSGYTIQNVDQTVQVLYSGHVVVLEQIQLSGQLPGTFELGLPYKYATHILTASAFDSNNNILPITLGVQLQEQSGFYGAIVSLPSGTSNNFTVAFTLSNAVLTKDTDGFSLDFPAYPAFVQTVAECNVNFNLPTTGALMSIDKPDGVVYSASYSKQNLPAFTYAPATAEFSVSSGYLEKIDVLSLTRQVNISPSGAITSTDSFKIANNSTGYIRNLLLNLPLNAKNVVARDQFGRILSASKLTQLDSRQLVYNVTFATSVSPGAFNIVTLDYSLPSVSPSQFSQYTLDLDLFPYLNCYVDSASVTFTPPEGAKIVTPDLSQLGSSTDLSRNVFQETLVVHKDGVSFVDSLIPSGDFVSLTFDYNPLWIAFRPTSWMFALAIVGVIIVLVYMRPKAKKEAPRISVVKMARGVTLSAEHITNFTEAYEERSKINQEIKALAARAKHGRIPRRRYKVQRRTLELRLENLSQTIARLKAIISNAGGSYADIVRQLEAAEVELNEVQLSLETIEVRHEAGEMPLETYRKQLTDLERRKEKAEAAVDGLLLRLRGEA